MSFDEQPDGDIHGECAAEIHRLEQQNAELLAALETMSHWHGDDRFDSLIAKVKQP